MQTNKTHQLSSELKKRQQVLDRIETKTMYS